jgi:GTP-binding protein
MSRGLVALVGRPNVGKSTLFNRIIGERLSVVDDNPGTTRDRIQAPVEWRGVGFTLVDTGGIEPLEPLRDKQKTVLAAGSKDFIYEIREQAEMAIAEADVLVFTCESTVGLTSIDQAVAEIIRKLIGQRQQAGAKVPPVLVAASKADNDKLKAAAVEFYALGLGEVFAVSGTHGDGVADLLDAVVQALPPEAPTEADESVKIALVGRPNVGKSSLFNRLIGEPRVIVSPVAGTTRDSVDTVIEFSEMRDARLEAIDSDNLQSPVSSLQSTKITLIDTAGIRKRGTIEPGVEKYSVLRAFKAMQRADVVLLLLDAGEGIIAQDEHIAGYILDENKSAIVCVNKWDMVESPDKIERIAKPVAGYGLLTEKMRDFLQVVQNRLNFMAYVPTLFTSAKLGFRTDQVLSTALRAYESRAMRISTSDVNRILREAQEKHAPPGKGGRFLKFYYGSQVGINPPHFVFFVNDPRLVHFTYQRFLENRIRDEFGFMGTPISLSFKGRRNEDK